MRNTESKGKIEQNTPHNVSVQIRHLEEVMFKLNLKEEVDKSGLF